MKKKLLIVDDKFVFRKAIISRIKKIAEVEIIGEAANGKEFLDMLEKELPDIVFLDLEMPIMNGLEATQHAIRKYPDLTIIIFSIYDDPLYVKRSLQAGAKGYMLKFSDNTEVLKSLINDLPTGNKYFLSKEIDISFSEKQKNKTILLVDDFQISNEVVADMLISKGYEVLMAHNGNTALNYFDGRTIDLMITDYKMPGMDGLELVKKVRNLPDYHGIGILILSSSKDATLIKRARKIGATGWLTKPFDIEKVTQTIEKII